MIKTILLLAILTLHRGHLTANEFSIDLFSSLMFNEGNMRTQPDENTIKLSNNTGLAVSLSLINNCCFSEDTLEGDTNLRLSRVLTDCIEVECVNGGNFSFSIEIS